MIRSEVHVKMTPPAVVSIVYSRVTTYKMITVIEITDDGILVSVIVEEAVRND